MGFSAPLIRRKRATLHTRRQSPPIHPLDAPSLRSRPQPFAPLVVGATARLRLRPSGAGRRRAQRPWRDSCWPACSAPPRWSVGAGPHDPCGGRRAPGPARRPRASCDRFGGKHGQRSARRRRELRALRARPARRRQVARLHRSQRAPAWRNPPGSPHAHRAADSRPRSPWPPPCSPYPCGSCPPPPTRFTKRVASPGEQPVMAPVPARRVGPGRVLPRSGRRALRPRLAPGAAGAALSSSHRLCRGHARRPAGRALVPRVDPSGRALGRPTSTIRLLLGGYALDLAARRDAAFETALRPFSTRPSGAAVGSPAHPRRSWPAHAPLRLWGRPDPRAEQAGRAPRRGRWRPTSARRPPSRRAGRWSWHEAATTRPAGRRSRVRACCSRAGRSYATRSTTRPGRSWPPPTPSSGTPTMPRWPGRATSTTPRNSGDAEALRGHVGALLSAGRPAEAAPVARRLVIVTPRDARAYADLAVALDGAGERGCSAGCRAIGSRARAGRSGDRCVGGGGSVHDSTASSAQTLA